MAKVALLVGVSEYEPGLNPLPAAVKDVEAMHQALIHVETGGFAESDVAVLKNPAPWEMSEAIENLFNDRHRDDLVLLFFSGHGLKDDTGRLYLATRNTRKSQKGELIRSTAVAANFVHDSMSRSRSRRQVVILDSCFSGAFAEGLSAKDDGAVNVREQLGGEGRAVLTSSTSTQYSFEQAGSALSVYTQYLIEGIKTGAADEDADGVVSIDELHEYASRRVREIQPAMKPEIYAVREGFKIRLTKVPPLSVSQSYRKEVTRFVSRGEISFVGRKTLDVLRTRLGLALAEAKAIEDDVLEPCRRDFREKLRQYKEIFTALVDRDVPITEGDRKDLRHSQQILGLRNEDTVPIEAQVLADLKAYKQSLQTYEQALTETLRQEYPLSVLKQQQFHQMKQQMKLSDGDVAAITSRVTTEVETFHQHLQQYEQSFDTAIRQDYPLSEFQRQELQKHRVSLSLSEVDVAPVEAKITSEIKTYQQKAQQYEEALMKATQGKFRLSEVTRQQLQQTWQALSLTEADVREIEAPILAQVESHQANLRQYEQEFTDATRQQHPLGAATQQELRHCQQRLNLSDEDVAPIQTRITTIIEEHLQKLALYEQVLSEAIQFEYPLSGVTREEVQRFQQVLELSDADAAYIEAQVLMNREVSPPKDKTIAEPLPELGKSSAVIPPSPSLPTAVEKGQAVVKSLRPLVNPLADAIRVLASWTKVRSSRMVMITGMGVAFVGLSSLALLINEQFRQVEFSLQNIKDSKAASKFDDCVRAALEIKQDSRIFRDAQSLLNDCRTANAQASLNRATQLAKESKWKEAISEADKIPTTASVANEAKNLIEQWAANLLQQATKQYESGKLDVAVSLAQAVPQDSTSGKKAKQLIEQWKKEWTTNEANLKAAQAAIEQRKWQAAIDSANQITDNPFWNTKTQSIVQKAQSQLAVTTPAPTSPTPTATTSTAPAEPLPAPAPSYATIDPPPSDSASRSPSYTPPPVEAPVPRPSLQPSRTPEVCLNNPGACL